MAALTGVTLSVRRGEVHALVGENGAGKSTLMKVVAGAVRPDAGTMEVGGRTVSFRSPADARASGVGIVHQELSLLPSRSVLANLFVNREPARFGLISRRKMETLAQPLIKALGIHAALTQPVELLPIAERQLIELGRVLLERPSLVLLDEPNSALNRRESQRLFTLLRQFAADGIGIVYVSHRLEEVLEIADTVSVMRNGAVRETRPVGQWTMLELVAEMTGRDAAQLLSKARRSSDVGGPATLTVREFSTSSLSNISFEVRRGEIVGIVGLDGSGAADLLPALYGATKSRHLASVIAGGPLPETPTEAARRRIAYVPADRRGQGLMMNGSVVTNLVQVLIGAMTARTNWVFGRDTLRSVGVRNVARLGIKAPGLFAEVSALSGGNQQKVVFGKWLEIDPVTWLLDDPARGVDLAAKNEIFSIVRQEADRGKAVILRSTELGEALEWCDRVLVFYRGQLVLNRMTNNLADSDLLHAMNTGQLPEGVS